MISEPSRTIVHRSRPRYLSFAALLAIFVIALQLRADEPYARSRDYDLQNGESTGAFFTDEERTAIENGTYNGVDAPAVAEATHAFGWIHGRQVERLR